MREDKLVKAEILSDKFGTIKIVTNDGRELTGCSWGIQRATDETTGDELDINCILFKPENGELEEITNEEIVSVEKA